MKRFKIYAALLVILLLVVSCTKESTAEPEKEEESIKATQTIGPEGGTVGLDDILLEIPENAFDLATTLSLTLTSVDPPFEDYAASEMYEITGLPDSFSEPLKVTIKHSGNLKNGTFVALGEQLTLTDPDEIMTFYSYHKGTDTSGYIIAEIPANDENELKKSTLKSFADEEAFKTFFTLVTDFINSEVTENNSMSGPSENEEIVKDAAENVESLLKEMGIEMNDLYRVKTIVQPCMPYIERRVVESDRGLEWNTPKEEVISYTSTVLLDGEHLDEKEIIPELGRCYFQLYVQKDFAPPHLLAIKFNTVKNDRNKWLHAAIAAWSEIYFSQNGDYVPSNFLTQTDAPFHYKGLAFQVEDYKKHLNFGYGMSAFIKYLVNEPSNGPKMIVDFYKALEKSQHDCHLTNLLDLQDKPVRVVWPDFVSSYLQGNVIDFPPSDIIDPLGINWTVDSKEKKEWGSTIVCPDICCKLRRFSFDWQDMPDNASLKLSVESTDLSSDLYKLLVFEYDGNKLNLLGEAGEKDLLISNVRALCTNKRDLILGLVKSHYAPPFLDGSDEITIRAKIINNPWWKPIGVVSCVLSINVHTVYKEAGWEPDDKLIYVSIFASTEFGTYTIEDNQYRGEWDYSSSENVQNKGNLVVEYDTETNAITSFECNLSIIGQGENPFTMNYYLKGNDLPNTQDNEDNPGNAIIYSLSGASAHLAVTAIDYTSDDSFSTSNYTSGPVSNSDSRVAVSFYSPLGY